MKVRLDLADPPEPASVNWVLFHDFLLSNGFVEHQHRHGAYVPLLANPEDVTGQVTIAS